MLALTVLTWQALSLSMGPVRHRAASPIRHGAISACDGSDDLNFLQTKLHRAVADEDYEAAAMLRDKIERNAGVAGVCDWGSLGVPEWLADRLHKLNFAMPTRVQLQALRATSGGDDAAICADTGSGKTLAYLAPLVQELRAREAAEGRAAPGEVRALVLAPTAELAAQVSRVAKKLSSSGAPFRSAVVTGEHKWRTQKEAAANGLELLVATPGRLRAHLEAEPPSFSLGAVRRVVLDEVCARARAASPPSARPPARPPVRPPRTPPRQVDVMYDDDDFVALWETLRAELPERAAAAFITATLPPRVRDEIKRQFPLVEERLGKGLHRTYAGVRERLVDCSSAEGGDGLALKTSALLRELADGEDALVFCNTIESCRRVENALRRAAPSLGGASVGAYHGAIAADARRANLAAFAAPKHANGAPRYLVCTDRASRGMDFPDIRHVVLYDFPRDGVEYLRRVGRVTRGGRAPGRVTSLVLGRQLTYARALMKIDERGEQIDLEVHG